MESPLSMLAPFFRKGGDFDSAAIIFLLSAFSKKYTHRLRQLRRGASSGSK